MSTTFPEIPICGSR
jgi:hypothetical protein